MTLVRNNGEFITPTPLEVRLLLALLKKPNNAYRIARQAELDEDNIARISNGTYQPAIKRLQQVGLIDHLKNGDYQITLYGKMILGQELTRYQRFITLARQRQRD